MLLVFCDLEGVIPDHALSLIGCRVRLGPEPTMGQGGERTLHLYVILFIVSALVEIEG